MAKNRENLKFLSQSVLLEEGGLPGINNWIIFTITGILVLFIGWSAVMQIDEVISVKGSMEKSESDSAPLSAKVQIPAQNIGAMAEGQTALITIPGLNDKHPIVGTVLYIDQIATVNQVGHAYYQGIVLPSQDQQVSAGIIEHLVSGMNTDVRIVVGSRSLMAYLLGPILSTQENLLIEE